MTKQLNQSQEDAVTHIYETGEALLVGQMGSGKTIVALTAMQELLDDSVVSRVLVFAPPAVVSGVWGHEYKEWSHTSGMTVGLAVGTPKQRLAVVADDSIQVVVMSYDVMAWFFDSCLMRFDMLVLDEITKIKGGGAGFKRMRKHIGDFKVRVGMTGTPVSESFEQIFYQVMALDGGCRFGRNKGNWLEKYFTADYNGYNWTIQDDGATRILDKVDDLVVVLPDYADELPPLEVEYVEIDLDQVSRDYYNQFERDQVNQDVTADNAAILVGKLQQIASGFIYDDSGETIHIHDCKTAYLDDLSGPCIYVYQFAEELARLMTRYPDGVLYNRADDSLARFRDGSITRLFLHPRSAGHGLDLTCCSQMTILSPIWSRDLTRQTIARIWRRNQADECLVTVLCARDTIDESIVARENDKASHHDVLMTRLGHHSGDR
jgi:superfamily II DNA or RNA helicase